MLFRRKYRQGTSRNSKKLGAPATESKTLRCVPNVPKPVYARSIRRLGCCFSNPTLSMIADPAKRCAAISFSCICRSFSTVTYSLASYVSSRKRPYRFARGGWNINVIMEPAMQGVVIFVVIRPYGHNIKVVAACTYAQLLIFRTRSFYPIYKQAQ